MGLLDLGGNDAASKAAENQINALNEAQEIYNKGYRQTTGYAAGGYDEALNALYGLSDIYDPYMAAGNDAAMYLSELIRPGSTYYAQDPGYQWRLAQGLDATQNAAVARGMGMSGNTLKALNDYAQGAAAQEYGNTFNRYMSLAGLGLNANAGKVGLTTQTGNTAISKGMTMADLRQMKVGQDVGVALGKGQASAMRELTQGQNDMAGAGFWGGLGTNLLGMATSLGTASMLAPSAPAGGGYMGTGYPGTMASPAFGAYGARGY